MTVRYASRRSDDGTLRERMRSMATERRRFGYRRLHVLLKREGFVVNHKRLFRMYREEKLTVRRRGGRKRAMGTRSPMLLPMVPNERKRPVGYALSRWAALEVYLDDGTVEIDNNAAERAIRPIAVGRNNWLFAGSNAGGERTADILTLIETAKLNGLEP